MRHFHILSWQMSTMNASVESLISSLVTILKLTEETVSFNDMNETFLYLKQEIRACVDKTERNLETLRNGTDKELGHHTKSLTEINGKIQQLNTINDDKFNSFTNYVKSQMSTMNASVEWQISSLETILKLGDETVSFKLKEYSNDMNEIFLYLKQEIKACVDKTERNLETLRSGTDKELDHHTKSLTEINGTIQQLNTINDDKFNSFTNYVKSQMSTMNASVESQISSLETILKHTEETIRFTLKEYSNDMNETFSYLKQEIKTFVDENEQNLETPRGANDKESENPIESLNEANGAIHKLKTRIVKVETRQGKRVAFFARRAEKRSNGKLRFS
ncbi:repetitive organellar protein-like [Mercenaria mercenaria]|uniref:repetitive organellar protein-like n=1 Tax=Mercenaria mercenaria TaxID=6596 RepID=UPI00234F7BBD|nr:repetitive organellar protein-like [Mercenaria mercenaria]